MEEKKSNGFLTFVKGLLIIIFIIACTFGGLFAGKRLAIVEYEKQLKENEEDNKDNSDNKNDEVIDKCVDLSDQVKNSTGNYISVSYTNDKLYITELNFSDMEEAQIKTFLYLSSDVKVAKAKVMTGIGSDASEHIVVIGEDGLVYTLNNNDDNEYKLIKYEAFGDTKVKDVISIENPVCSSDDTSDDCKWHAIIIDDNGKERTIYKK